MGESASFLLHPPSPQRGPLLYRSLDLRRLERRATGASFALRSTFDSRACQQGELIKSYLSLSEGTGHEDGPVADMMVFLQRRHLETMPSPRSKRGAWISGSGRGRRNCRIRAQPAAPPPFLRLPPELRDHIHHLWADVPSECRVLSSRTADPTKDLAWLHTCRMMYYEAYPRYLSNRPLWFPDLPDMFRYLRSLSDG